MMVEKARALKRATSKPNRRRVFFPGGSATTLGFKPATLRQWRRRRAIPAAAKSRLVYFFNDNFEILVGTTADAGELNSRQHCRAVYPMEPKYDQSA